MGTKSDPWQSWSVEICVYVALMALGGGLGGGGLGGGGFGGGLGGDGGDGGKGGGGEADGHPPL